METPQTHQNTNTVSETDGDNSGYISGVCNIGPQEIKKRRDALFFSAAFLVIIIIMIQLFHANHLWRLVIFLPALSLGVGFQQWYFKFCVNFGLRGVFNFGDLGKTYTVDQKEYFKKDRLRAITFIVTALFFAVVAAVVYYLI